MPGPRCRPVSARVDSPERFALGDSGKASSMGASGGPRPPPGAPTRPVSAAGGFRRPGQGGGCGGGGCGASSNRPRSALGSTGGSDPAATGTSGGRRTLPAELGLAGRRVLTLPSHVDQCDQGENCCWRWLAHAVLKEASWLKEDLDSAREEHQVYTRDRLKAEHDAEAFAELRGAHAETVRELNESRGEISDLRRELAALKTAHAHKAAREQELERDLARVDRDRRDTALREVEALRRAEGAEREVGRLNAVVEDLQNQILALQDTKARMGAELSGCRSECETLRKAVEEAGTKKKKGNKRGSAGAGRTNSLRRPGASPPRR